MIKAGRSGVDRVGILSHLDFGSGVAEQDDNLEKYFIETPVYRDLLLGRVDIIAGDKGVGKSALFRSLVAKKSVLSIERGVEVLPAFNPQGSPIFQRLLAEDTYSEEKYRSIWKTYILALVGNWLLGCCPMEWCSWR